MAGADDVRGTAQALLYSRGIEPVVGEQESDAARARQANAMVEPRGKTLPGPLAHTVPQAAVAKPAQRFQVRGGSSLRSDDQDFAFDALRKSGLYALLEPGIDLTQQRNEDAR